MIRPVIRASGRRELIRMPAAGQQLPQQGDAEASSSEGGEEIEAASRRGACANLCESS